MTARQSARDLCEILGASRALGSIGPADVDQFRAALVHRKLAKATVAKRCRYAKHFFAVAQRQKLIAANPFEHLRGAVKGNPERRVFVPADVVQRVIDFVPCPQWKLMIALARWGGLRCPSEILSLRWTDVDFANKRFIVRASKPEDHADGGIRVVPMFPELVEHFQRVFDEAEEGAVYVITRYRDKTQNLGTQFRRWIEQAGETPWPKLWQNLRASRATELADQFPGHVAAKWLGHTERIADEFYRTVTDEHFARAVGDQPCGERKAAQKAAQNPAQLLHERARTAPQPPNGGFAEVTSYLVCKTLSQNG